MAVLRDGVKCTEHFSASFMFSPANTYTIRCGQRPWQKLEPFHSLLNHNCYIKVEIFCEKGHNSDENQSS